MSIQAPRIGIVDTCCPAPYGLGVLATRPLGGTEATVLKIVHALQGKFRFSLFQRNAPTSNGSGGAACTSGPSQSTDGGGTGQGQYRRDLRIR